MIKMKTNLKILLWLAIPLMFMFFLNMVASFQYWDTEGLYSDFNKTFNHKAACYISVAGIFTIMAVCFTSMRLMYVANDIDNLEEAKHEYEVMKDEMEVARDKYTELLLENSTQHLQANSKVNRK